MLINQVSILKNRARSGCGKRVEYPGKHTMTKTEKNNKSNTELAGEDLFNFAMEREDIKILVAHLPEETKCKPEAVEYELQILKLISTGWSISFFLQNTPHLDQLSQIYWKSIHEFSETLSETTQMMTGTDINYFQVLKDRLEMYVTALSQKADTAEPAAVIGPEFARACGNGDDIYAVQAGSRMFIIAVSSVNKYLESIELK